MITRRFLAATIAVLGAASSTVGSALAQAPFITVASTTSTEQSGLFGHLLPAFTKATGIGVRVVAVGTGQALKLGERGDADVVLVHDTPSELKFVADGWGVGRQEVTYNDFVVVGPKADPAGVAGSADTVASFRRIAAARAPFITRGDDSGTHKAELRFWADAGIDPKAASAGGGKAWYTDIGGGMGQALNMAAVTGAYTLADRGTWLSFQNRQDLAIAVQGDRRLFNQYGVMLVNPARHPSVKADLGRGFMGWLVSLEGQGAIASYKVGGEQLFFPNAGKSGS
jgi:tungstate transport system substrate-binding protein